MDLGEIQRTQEIFVKDLHWDRFLASQVFTHLIEELGEIGKHILYEEQYKVKGAGHSGTKNEIEQEFAQVFNLFLQLASKMQVNLEDAWEEEFQKNQKRFDKDQWKQLAKQASEEEES